MSRIGRMPIALPQHVTISVAGNLVSITGPKGSLAIPIPDGVQVTLENAVIKITLTSPAASALQGLIRALVFNAVQGVSVGWRKVLELNGTGYRAMASGQDLNLALGFSHPVVVKSPPGISFEVSENKVAVIGVDRSLVGDVAAKIRALRPADPYKLKGFKYEGEKLTKKAGKAVKAGTTVTK